MAIAGEENHAVDLLLGRATAASRFCSCGNWCRPSKRLAAVPELAAGRDELDRRARREERLLQPLELRRAEHRLLGHVGIAVGVTVGSGRRAGRARRRRSAPSRTRRERRAGHSSDSASSAGRASAFRPSARTSRRCRWARNRDRRGWRGAPCAVSKLLQRREAPRLSIARRHRRRIEQVRRLQVDVVAEPEHEVRRFGGDGVEDLVVAAAVRGRPDRDCEIVARADGDGELRGGARGCSSSAACGRPRPAPRPVAAIR